MLNERPVIKIDNNADIHLAVELFQNDTLRPIIKMQHDLLLTLFNNLVKRLSIKWQVIEDSKKIKLVKSQISSNTQFKNQLLGIIIGQFDKSELDKYLLNSKEYNKRTLNIVAERLISTIKY